MSKTYTTVDGDMWDSIAYNSIGSVMYTDQIMSLNMEYIDHYIFPAGVEIVLPELEDARVMSGTMPPWKKVNW